MFSPLFTLRLNQLVLLTFDSKLMTCSSSQITVPRSHSQAFSLLTYTRDMPTVMLTNACTPLGQVNGAMGTAVGIVLNPAGKSPVGIPKLN